MSIFGTSYGKFVTGSNEVLFEHSGIIPSYLNSEWIEHISILTGIKHYLNLKDRSSFIVNINLFKYDDPTTKFAEIFQYKDDTVFFYPHADGDVIKDIYGSAVGFKMVEITPYYLTQDATYDVLKIKFESTDYHYYGAILSQGYGHSYGIQYGIGF